MPSRGSDVDDVRARPKTDWLPATVPGGAHEALLAAGRIADPYFDRKENTVRWVEDRAVLRHLLRPSGW